MNTPPKTTTAALKKMARKLLTTTCLTAAAAGAAQATTLNETTDLGNSFLTNTPLPVGTDRVTGTLNGGFDPADFFKFTNLVGGSSYTLTGLYTGFQTVTVLNSAQAVLNAPVSNPASFTGIVPTDGMLIVGVIDNDGAQSYDLSLNAGQSTTTPEPATFAGAGLALAGLMALRSISKK